MIPKYYRFRTEDILAEIAGRAGDEESIGTMLNLLLRAIDERANADNEEDSAYQDAVLVGLINLLAPYHAREVRDDGGVEC